LTHPLRGTIDVHLLQELDRPLRCGSPWLKALAEAETPATRARMVSIFSWHDSIAGPPCTAWLEGARHVPLAGIGHVSLLRDPRAVTAVVEALATLRGTAP
jgi:hypothetical protein